MGESSTCFTLTVKSIKDGEAVFSLQEQGTTRDKVEMTVEKGKLGRVAVIAGLLFGKKKLFDVKETDGKSEVETLSVGETKFRCTKQTATLTREDGDTATVTVWLSSEVKDGISVVRIQSVEGKKEDQSSAMELVGSGTAGKTTWGKTADDAAKKDSK
jgi:hypothetical protein